MSAAPKGEPAEEATVKAQKVPTEKTPNPPVQEPKPEILKKRIKIVIFISGNCIHNNFKVGGKLLFSFDNFIMMHPQLIVQVQTMTFLVGSQHLVIQVSLFYS